MLNLFAGFTAHKRKQQKSLICYTTFSIFICCIRMETLGILHQLIVSHQLVELLLKCWTFSFSPLLQLQSTVRAHGRTHSVQTEHSVSRMSDDENARPEMSNITSESMCFLAPKINRTHYISALMYYIRAIMCIAVLFNICIQIPYCFCF